MPTPSTPTCTDVNPIPADVPFGDLPARCAFVYDSIPYLKLDTVVVKLPTSEQVAFGFFGNNPVSPKRITDIEFGI